MCIDRCVVEDGRVLQSVKYVFHNFGGDQMPLGGHRLWKFPIELEC